MKGLRTIGTILAVLLLVGSVFAASVTAKQNKENKINRAKGFAEKIEKDLEKTGEYSEADLEEVVGLLEDLASVKMDPENRKALKSYIIEEIKKDIRIKKIDESSVKGRSVELKPKKVRTDVGIIYELSSGPVYRFAQPTVDITGGSGIDDAGWFYDINGNNDLYSVIITDLGSKLKYTLWYYDEDYPIPAYDPIYDYWRTILYDYGPKDKEVFYVWDSGTIEFDGIWSNDKTFARVPGQHGDRSFSLQSIVYIAVWNHAMDVNDDNPSLSKTYHYY